MLAAVRSTEIAQDVALKAVQVKEELLAPAASTT
jgi:hypothetical protein